MIETKPVVRWDEPMLRLSDGEQFGEQIGHADAPATEHMPVEQDGWYITLCRDRSDDDWILYVEWAAMVDWEDPCCPDANGIIHLTPTGTACLGEALAIASAHVEALQRGYMGGTRPLRRSELEEQMGPLSGVVGHPESCSCDECDAVIETARKAYWDMIEADFIERAAAKAASLHLLGPEVRQQLGLVTSRFRFLDCADETDRDGVRYVTD